MTNENQNKIDAEITKLLAEVSNLNAATAKLQSENKYYPLIVGSTATLAIVAVVKIFF